MHPYYHLDHQVHALDYGLHNLGVWSCPCLEISLELGKPKPPFVESGDSFWGTRGETRLIR